MNREIVIRYTKRVAVIMMAALVTSLLGCSGEDGPPGQDGVAPDNNPPSIALLEPQAGDTLTDTLRVTVNAVDNVGIERVIFYLDGSDRIDDTSYAQVSEPPYQYTFNLTQLGVENGPHTVMARAFDNDNNHTDTPPILVYTERTIPPGPAVLRSWEPDSLGFYLFPNRFPDDTVTIDTLHNVRLSPERRCVLDSIRIYLGAGVNPGLAYDSDLIIGIHGSDGVYPTNMLASQLLDLPAEFDSTGWYSVSFIDDALEFFPEDRFHVSVSVGTLTDSTRMAMGVSIREKYLFPTFSQSTLYYKGGAVPRWQSLQQSFATSDMTREFMIEAWVLYLEEGQ